MHIPRHQKTYLSRQMTRAMALDHPIGDPHGGPAYGERNEPISAIMAVGTMFATGGAMAAGSIMAGVAFAGAALSLVGNVTGNKTLSKIGMVAGLVGGAGMAGLFGEAAQGATWAGTLGGESAVAGAGAAPGMELTQTPTANPGAQTSPVPNAQLDVQSLAPQAVPTPGPASEGLIASNAPGLSSQPGAVTPGPQAPAADLLSPTPGPQAAGPSLAGGPSGPAAPGVSAPTAPNAFTGQTSTGLATLPGDSQSIAKPGFFDQLKTGNYLDAAKTAGAGVMDLAKSNPGAAYMLSQAAGGVSDVLSGKTGAQINALEAQGQLTRAEADRIRYQIETAERRRKQLNTNMALPLPNMSINPNAVQFSQPGLINGARAGG